MLTAQSSMVERDILTDSRLFGICIVFFWILNIQKPLHSFDAAAWGTKIVIALLVTVSGGGAGGNQWTIGDAVVWSLNCIFTSMHISSASTNTVIAW